MRIYHTETQEDYDELMVELEAENYVWSSGYRPTEWRKWSDNGKDTCIAVQDKLIYYSNTSFYNQFHPDILIVEYKLKFTKENVVVPKCFDEWFKEIVFEYPITDSSKRFALWKLSQQGFGHGFEDARGKKISYETELGGWLLKNKELAIDAVLNGYTVEPEQLYYIPLPHLELSDGTKQVLSKRGDTYFASRPNDKLKQRYTKEELEQVPEIYKPYAKPIKEEEE